MSKLIDQLRKVQVYNPHNFYGNQPFISLRVNHGSGDVLPSAWRVNKAGEKLSDAWYDYGAKSFSYGSREDKKDQLEAAKAWASEKFGITCWMRDPFGSYGEEAFVKKRIRELRAAASEKGDE